VPGEAVWRMLKGGIMGKTMGGHGDLMGYAWISMDYYT
jgi:hypothetical protein